MKAVTADEAVAVLKEAAAVMRMVARYQATTPVVKEAAADESATGHNVSVDVAKLRELVDGIGA